MDNNNEFKNNNPDFEGETKYDVENNKDSKEGSEENREILEEEKKNSFEEEKAAYEKEESNGEQKEGYEEKGEDDVNSSQKSFSANYEPPYYVPNFTVYGDDSQAPIDKEEKKPKKTMGIGLVAIICAVSVLVSATLGALAGAIAGGGKSLEINAGGNKENISIIRSDREINVEEITGSTGYTELNVAQVAALVGDSVVEITTTHVQTNAIYGQYITSGAGSGVIFSQNESYGYIVTNYHVIEGANEISVTVNDGDNAPTVYDKAEYIAGDEAEDIAVIRIPVSSGVKLKQAVFVSDSDKLAVGERVVAIGNPLGQLGGTVTDGIISALDRTITVGDNVMTLLQTNAAINPGNSGGGLFNMSGELIGIVNAKQSSTGIEGLGFAIPANIVAKDIKDILELGYISGRPTIGIEVQYGTYQGETGVFVSNKGSTGFERYDQITKINGIEIKSMAAYNAAVKSLTIGETVDIEVKRYSSLIGWRTGSVSVEVSENKSK